jgi:broad specificity phosphatase PhoE
MSLAQKWPDVLWIVRHGESAANVAREQAEAAGRPSITVATRDVDIPLSELGERQAAALGRWFGQMTPAQRPDVVLTSPYLRARTTADLVVESAGLDRAEVEIVVDERLREREFGILDGLTRVGVQLRYPEQYELKQAIGKFYHRPPGGESWCDVILRLRSVCNTITRDYRRMRVLIVCHAVVVLCFRYLFDHMKEDEILSVDRLAEIANCSVTTYSYDPTLGARGRMTLRGFNFVAPLEAAGAPVTSAPDSPVAPK